MSFLPIFFEIFENKRLFALWGAVCAAAWVSVRHKLWYTVSIFAPDMVQIVNNPPVKPA